MDITGKQSRVYTFGLSILWHNFLIFFVYVYWLGSVFSTAIAV